MLGEKITCNSSKNGHILCDDFFNKDLINALLNSH